MTPKKILLMAHDVTLAHLGRPLRLAEGLIADGHAVTLAASAESARFLKDFPGEVRTLAPTGKARFIDNLAKGRPVFDFETLRRFCEEDEALLATLRPDLVIGWRSGNRDAHLARQKVEAQETSESMSLWMTLPALLLGVALLAPALMNLLTT